MKSSFVLHLPGSPLLASFQNRMLIPFLMYRHKIKWEKSVTVPWGGARMCPFLGHWSFWLTACTKSLCVFVHHLLWLLWGFLSSSDSLFSLLLLKRTKCFINKQTKSNLSLSHRFYLNVQKLAKILFAPQIIYRICWSWWDFFPNTNCIGQIKSRLTSGVFFWDWARGQMQFGPVGIFEFF